MAKSAFDKFINKAPSGARKKEAIRQEKKKMKLELKKRGEEERRHNEERFGLITSSHQRTDKKTPGFSKKDETPQRQYNKPAPRYKKGKPVPLTYEQITQKPQEKQDEKDIIPLNKFIAHAGVCGRREAADIVKEGKAEVNGSIIFEPGHKVSINDKVFVKGKQVYLQKNAVYILVNKPKDYITTAKDPEGRRTWFELLNGATKERV